MGKKILYSALFFLLIPILLIGFYHFALSCLNLEEEILNFSQALRRVHIVSFFDPNIHPTQKLRVVFDAGGSLIAIDPTTDPKLDWKDRMILRDGAGLFIKELRERGHAAILFTSASRDEWNYLKSRIPELDIFNEVYTRDEIKETEITINDQKVKYKDIRHPLIKGDFLIDDNKDLTLVAQQIGMEKNFIQIFPFDPAKVRSEEVKPFEWIKIIVNPIQNSGG